MRKSVWFHLDTLLQLVPASYSGEYLQQVAEMLDAVHRPRTTHPCQCPTDADVYSRCKEAKTGVIERAVASVGVTDFQCVLPDERMWYS